MTIIQQDPVDDTHSTKRLHISPFNQTFYDRIIPASLHPIAQNVSFHTTQTSPERGFGYVELPSMDADKLKNKLNGTLLKGSKIRIEEARPEKKRRTDTAVDESQEGSNKQLGKTKQEKAKKRDGIIVGHELEDGRHVKRGWTAGDGTKQNKKSREKVDKDHLDASMKDRKLRFKTTVPPNKVSIDANLSDKTKQKKSKTIKSGKGDTIVEEFTKRRKSLQTSSANASHTRRAVAYEDDKGWVDEDGNVVEAAPRSRKSVSQRKEQKSEHEHVYEDQPMDAESKGSESDSDEDSSEREMAMQTAERHSASSPLINAPFSATETTTEPSSKRSGDLEEPNDIHPLEALYKRSAPDADADTDSKPHLAPINTSFSFFGSPNGEGSDEDDVDADADATVHPPQTPHTRRDMEWRSQRSAAPTPDTAAIGKRFGSPFGPDEDDEESEEDVQHLAAIRNGLGGAHGSGQQEESAFRKLFYEKRGESDRAWKKRRREMKKQQRQRNNRRLSRKVV